jgi:hypothetical protein
MASTGQADIELFTSSSLYELEDKTTDSPSSLSSKTSGAIATQAEHQMHVSFTSGNLIPSFFNFVICSSVNRVILYFIIH